MEEKQEDSKVCSHCKKEVAESNFDLHESHCGRFLTQCPKCKESVPWEQLEQHQSDQHALVRCSKCTKKLERCYLQDHEAEECEGRMQCCQFCELDVPFRDLADHTVVCSSRTTLCPDCGRYVKLLDLDGHVAQCSSVPIEGNPPQDTTEGAAASTQTKKEQLDLSFKRLEFIPSDQSWKHQINSSASSHPGEKQDQLINDFRSFSSSKSKNMEKEELVNDVNQISTCPICHLALPLPTLKRHERKCRVFEDLKRSAKTGMSNAAL